MKSTVNQGLARDLASLWFNAPMVIAIRTQAMGMAMLTGSTGDIAEFNRMVTEKTDAAAESAMAINASIAKHGLAAATAMATGRKPASGAKTAGKIAHEAIKPYSKRVRANAKRLTKKKV
jgi:3-oxoacyl-ACP reductase-like protein